jgi:hypothetical protein
MQHENLLTVWKQLGNVLYFYDKNLANQFKKGLVSKMDVLHNIHSMFAEVAT